jgi:prepilin-type N-terminal cleavage/methylation domain-containing protein
MLRTSTPNQGLRSRRPGVTRSGLTLIEVLTSMTILGIVSVGVSALYIQAIRMYKRGSEEATAHSKAVLAVERILPELQEAYNVDFPGPDRLIFTLPQRGVDGHYEIDAATRSPISGTQVAVYTSDHTGAMETPGRYIWHAQRPSPAAEWQDHRVIMDDVEDLSFAYAPSTDRLEVVEVSITIGKPAEPGYFNRTEVAEIAIRNH